MSSLKKFFTQLEAIQADGDNATADFIKKITPDTLDALHQELENVESPEAAKLISWLGQRLSTLSGKSPVTEFALHLVPQLVELHLNLIGTVKHREFASGVECCLIYIYNQICEDPNSRKDIRLAKLESASIYHDAVPARQHLSLTVSVLNTEANVTTIGGASNALKGVDRIIAANRSYILCSILTHYCQTIGERPDVSRMAFCHMCTRVCLSGYDLKASYSRGDASPADIFVSTQSASQSSARQSSVGSLEPSAVLRTLQQKSNKSVFKSYALEERNVSELSQRPRHSLEPAVFQEMANGIHVCLFSGHESAARQALSALHWRATEALMPEVLMMTHALRHALKGPCGSPEDGLFGLSAQIFSSLPDSVQRVPSPPVPRVVHPIDTPDIAVQAPSPSPSPRHSSAGLPGDESANAVHVKLRELQKEAAALQESVAEGQVETLV